MAFDQHDPFVLQRDRMIADQLLARGIASARLLHAMASVPRHLFVPPELRQRAYDDCALPSLSGQTISQPFVVAYMTEHLRVEREHCVLEIGTGTGYQTAILAQLARRVYTIERISELATSAKSLLDSLGYANIRYHLGDGAQGWPEPLAFDRILLTAGTPEIPAPLLSQLAEGGILLAPRGSLESQTLIAITKINGLLSERSLIPVRFVPLIWARSS